MAGPGPTLNKRSVPPLIGPHRAEVDPNPVLSNLEVFPHPSVDVGQEGTRSGQAGQTRYKLARALSISDHHIRRW